MKILNPNSKYNTFKYKFIKLFGKEIFDLYERNAKEYLKNKGYTLSLREQLELYFNNGGNRPISCFFLWSNTPERTQFWIDIQTKFEYYYHEPY